MTQSQLAPHKQIARSLVIILAAVFVIGIFAMGFDQGHLFSIVQGESAFDVMYLHEATHDVRHIVGLPCH